MGTKMYTLEPPMDQSRYHKGGQKISKTNKNEHTILYWTLKYGEDITFFFFTTIEIKWKSYIIIKKFAKFK